MLFLLYGSNDNLYGSDESEALINPPPYFYEKIFKHQRAKFVFPNEATSSCFTLGIVSPTEDPTIKWVRLYDIRVK